MPILFETRRHVRSFLDFARTVAREAKLPTPSSDEAARIAKLRARFAALPPIEQDAGGTEPEWVRYQRELRSFVASRDPRLFIQWRVIASTMFFRGNEEELRFLQGLPASGGYMNAIAESPIGAPDRYPAFPASSGNLIHHAYSIAQLEQTFALSVRSLKTVIEFGGGYGSLARYIYQSGFDGNYVILDLPEFSLLQEYFLTSLTDLQLAVDRTGHPGSRRSVSLVSSPNEYRARVAGQPMDLFIATWSLSESPVAFRETILEITGAPKFFLIAYHEKFNDIDNRTYFEGFAAKRNDYVWRDYPIKHVPTSRYLLGRRQ